MQHLLQEAEARRRLTAPLETGLATVLVVAAGLLAAACSSAAPAASKGAVEVTTRPEPTSNWSTVDLNTGSVTPVRGNAATAGAFYVVSPDHSKVASNPCCSWETPARVTNVDGTHVHNVSAAGTTGVGEEWSPDSSEVVYQQRDGGSNQLGNLFVQNLATGRRTQVTNLDQKQWGWWFTFPSFSPDGKSVLYQRPSGHQPNDDNRSWNLWSAPVAGGKPTLVQRNAAWGSYSPDGKRLAYLTQLKEANFTGSRLWVRSLGGGTPHALVHSGGLRWVRWSPDGTRIAYSDGASIYVLDAATGKATKVADGGQPEWRDDHTLIYSR